MHRGVVGVQHRSGADMPAEIASVRGDSNAAMRPIHSANGGAIEIDALTGR